MALTEHFTSKDGQVEIEARLLPEGDIRLTRIQSGVKQGYVYIPADVIDDLIVFASQGKVASARGGG